MRGQERTAVQLEFRCCTVSGITELLESARGGVRRFPNRYWTQVNMLLALAAVGDLDALHRGVTRVTGDDPDPEIGRALKMAVAWLVDLMAQPGPGFDAWRDYSPFRALMRTD